MQFRRENIRLGCESYLGQRAYFVTACCERRRQFFATASHAEWIIDTLRRISSDERFGILAYCAMPDHLHILARGQSAESNLLSFVHRFKLVTTKGFAARCSLLLWQKKYYDHILRDRDSPEAVAWYIWLNPVRNKLCAKPEEYPFSGSFLFPFPPPYPDLPVWTPPWKRAQAV